MSKSKKQRRLMTEYVEALPRQIVEPVDSGRLGSPGRSRGREASQGSLFVAGKRPRVGHSVESTGDRTAHVKRARPMLRNAQAVLPVLFDSIQLPGLDAQPAHLCVLNAQ